MRETTILALDVVGFSKQVAENPKVTIDVLSARRKRIHNLVLSMNGRVFNEAGDSIVSEFSEADKAALCAMAIQEEMSRLNAGSPTERRMMFRAGINHGPVMDADDNVFGDTVNVAARLEAASSPEGVYLSKSAFDKLMSETKSSFAYLGELSLKNIPNPTAVYMWKSGYQMGRYGASNTEKVANVETLPGSIAVLLFKNLNSDEEQQYFCEGVSEDLISALSRYKSLRVTSSNASFAFVASEKTLQEISHALSAKYILSGAVRSMGNRVRINIKLDNSESSQTIWSEKFETTKEGIWELEETLASTVVSKLVGQVEKDEMRSSANKPPEDARAYDLVLQGLKHHRNSIVSREDARKAYDLFSRAVDLDPNYPRAMAWKVCSTANLSSWEPEILGPNWMQDALKSVEKALELDPDDAEANRIMGAMQLSNGNYEASLEHHRHACSLCPSDLYIAAKHCKVLMYDGRLDAAQNELDRATKINPTASDLLYEIEGVLKFWQQDHQASNDIFKRIKFPDPIISVFEAANNYHLGRIDLAAQKVAEIEADYGLSVERLIQDEPYRKEEMKSMLEPILKSSALV